MKILINPTYESLRPWIESLPETFAQQGEVIYDARNQIRIILAPNGKEMCVKRFHAPRFLNRFVYSFWRMPKAIRAFHNALRLKLAGIGTPEPVAFLLTKQCTRKESCTRITRRGIFSLTVKKTAR